MRWRSRTSNTLRPGRQALVETLLPEFRLAAPTDGRIGSLADCFPHAPADVWLELGFGSGEHLAAQARRLLAPTQLIGNSNATVQEAEEAQTQGADYIAVGAMFPTGTKEKSRPAGLETLRRVREVIEAPIIAIGGINVEPGDLVIADGAGVVFIPKASEAEVLDKAEDIAAREAAMARAVEDGKPVSQVMGGDYESMLKK